MIEHTRCIDRENALPRVGKNPLRFNRSTFRSSIFRPLLSKNTTTLSAPNRDDCVNSRIVLRRAVIVPGPLADPSGDRYEGSVFIGSRRIECAAFDDREYK